MRCACCNSNLSDFEATRKHAETGVYVDLCNECFHVVSQDCDYPVLERTDLHTAMDDDDVQLVNVGDELDDNVA